MLRQPILPATLLLVLAFAGCTSEPEARPVDFSGVDDSQPGAGFTLHVKVVGVGNETIPLPDAFVGAASKDHAVAKTTTDANGDATLRLRRDQTVRVVAKATGWTTEDSGEILIGDADEKDESHCGSFKINVGSQSQSQSWCVVTDSNASAAYRLDGREGHISIVLFQKQVERTLKATVSPHANAQLVVLPDNKRWFSQVVTLHEDPDLQGLYMNRLVETHTTLTWRNNLLQQGDFELGVGCARGAPSAVTGGTVSVPYLAQQAGPVSLTKDWNPKAKGMWADCDGFYAGPIVDTISTQIDTTVVAKLVFKGQSRIIPVNV